jgi:hypothetical protein
MLPRGVHGLTAYQYYFSGLSILFSLFALIVSGFTLYYTFFRHVPDLLVYLRFPQPKQLGTNTLDVNYFFSNMGNQTVFIEDVAIDELWIKSDRPGAEGTIIGEHGQIEWTDESSMCNDPNIYLETFMDTLHAFGASFPSSLTEQQHVPVMRSTTEDYRPLEGLRFALIKPARIYIEGAEAKAAAATVEAGKMKEIAATFERETIPLAKYNVVVCPVIRIFDSKGQPVLAVCKGGRAGHRDPPHPVVGDTI